MYIDEQVEKLDAEQLEVAIQERTKPLIIECAFLLSIPVFATII